MFKFLNLLIIKIKIKLKLISISDVVLTEGIIYCSYELFIAARMHHLHIKNKYKLPSSIIESFAFNYFSKEDKEFIKGCDEYNNAIIFLKNNSGQKVVKFNNGTELIILSCNDDNSNTITFTISNLPNFILVLRKYKSQIEVEEIINLMFK